MADLIELSCDESETKDLVWDANILDVHFKLDKSLPSKFGVEEKQTLS